MRLTALIFSIATIALSACTKSDTAPAPTPPVAEEAPTAAPAAKEALAAAPAGEAHVHGVACGCSQGQACSNMIEVDGKYLPLEGELGLGKMAFCGKQGLKAEAEGELEDGKFVATSFKLIEEK